MYDPTIGEWISEDPIGFLAGDTNLRRYVGNSPTNATDPSGQVLVFESKDSFANFKKELMTHGAKKEDIDKYLHSVTKDDEIHVVINPTDSSVRDAFFKHAQAQFPFLFTKGREFNQVDDLPPPTLFELGGSRYVVAAAIYNTLISAAFLDPTMHVTIGKEGCLTITGPSKMPDELSRAIEGTKVKIDIGGEGPAKGEVDKGCINVNTGNIINFADGKVGELIPDLVIRVQPDGRLAIASDSITEVVMNDTPVSEATAKELARIIKKGGTIRIRTTDKPSITNAIGAFDPLNIDANATEKDKVFTVVITVKKK